MQKETLIVIIFLILVLGLIATFVSIKREGDSSVSPEADKITKKEVINYLKDSVFNSDQKENIFADYYKFKETNNKLFIWAYISEYTWSSEGLEEESGMSLPIVVSYADGKITDHKQPHSGEDWSKSVKKIFPSELHEDVLNFHTKHEKNLNNLIDKVEEQAKSKLQKNGKLNYNFPEELDAEYISAQDWQVEVKDQTTLNCKKSEKVALPTKVFTKKIEGRKYCIKIKSEGAAGTTYKNYSYSTIKNNKKVTISFVAQYPQCGNFGEQQRTECQQEQDSFTFDKIITNIVESKGLN